MYLQKVVIENIRSIRHFEMKFPSPAGWHVLIGDNGSGKSTILKAIALAIIGPSETKSLRLDLYDYVSFDFEEGSVRLDVKPHVEDKYSGTSAPLKKPFDAGIKIIKEWERGVAKIDAFKQYKHAPRHIWSGRSGWFSAAYGPFRRFTGGNKEWDKVYYSNPQAAAHMSVFGEDVALTESIEWLVKLNYKKLEKDGAATQLLDDLQTFINDGQLLPQGAKLERISSKGVFLKDGYNKLVSVTQMSDGFRSVLSMTFDIIRQMIEVYGQDAVFASVREGDIKINLPGVIMVDEIDAHLHPTWQARIGNWFT